MNVRRVIRLVNTDMDEFMTDNANMSDVEFKEMLVGDRECF